MNRSGSTAARGRWSIRTRLIVILAAVVVVAIVVTTLVSTLVMGRFLEDRVTSRLEATGQRVQATLVGVQGITLTMDTITHMSAAEATTVVFDDGTAPPLFTRADLQTANELLALDLPPGRSTPVPDRQGMVAVDVDLTDLGLVIRDGARTMRPDRMILAIDSSEQLATVRLMVFANTAAVVLAIGILVILTVVIVSRGLRPLRSMADQAQAFADGDRSRRLTVPTDDPDISRLATTVNEAFDAQAEAQVRLRAFVADASHELRTPLTTATGWVELYFQGGLSDPVERDHALERVRTQLGRMRVLTDELTLLARLDRERDLADERLDLGQLATEATQDARVMNPDRTFTLSVSGPAPLRGDGPKLQQVLVNLLENAVQHTPAGTAVEVTVVPGRPSGQHVLLVTDHGPGISRQDQPHIFERFWRSDASRDRHTGGSGLGLSIVASIVQAHGGHCGVTSSPGRDCTFRISLPAAAADDRPAVRWPPTSVQPGTRPHHEPVRELVLLPPGLDRHRS